jgi:hypothetical protein
VIPCFGGRFLRINKTIAEGFILTSCKTRWWIQSAINKHIGSETTKREHTINISQSIRPEIILVLVKLFNFTKWKFSWSAIVILACAVVANRLLLMALFNIRPIFKDKQHWTIRMFIYLKLGYFEATGKIRPRIIVIWSERGRINKPTSETVAFREIYLFLWIIKGLRGVDTKVLQRCHILTKHRGKEKKVTIC